MSKVTVVAISGASGSGKTSAVKQLAALHACPYLLFDNFVDDQTYPKDMKTWLEQGADVSVIKTPRLVTALRELIGNCQSMYIFVEEPFGKCRNSMSTLIDYAVLLNPPLELCLSRVIRRNILLHGDRSLDMISAYLIKYDEYLRDVYIKSTESTRPTCDFIIEDVTSVQSIANTISDWLSNNARTYKHNTLGMVKLQ